VYADRSEESLDFWFFKKTHTGAATNRSGVPIEIVSKIILRHANLSTTQLYLGKISDTEAIRWSQDPF